MNTDEKIEKEERRKRKKINTDKSAGGDAHATNAAGANGKGYAKNAEGFFGPTKSALRMTTLPARSGYGDGRRGAAAGGVFLDGEGEDARKIFGDGAPAVVLRKQAAGVRAEAGASGRVAHQA